MNGGAEVPGDWFKPVRDTSMRMCSIQITPCLVSGPDKASSLGDYAGSANILAGDNCMSSRLEPMCPKRARQAQECADQTTNERN